MTSIFTEHVPPPGIVPPEKETEPAPAKGEKVGVPQPVVEAFGGVATTMLPGFVGKVSLKATPDNGLFWLGLVIVKVRVEKPLARIGFGANNLAMLGGFTAVREAVP